MDLVANAINLTLTPLRKENLIVRAWKYFLTVL